MSYTMLYMIVERFHPGKIRALYERVAEKGRQLPEGVNYINSWIDEDVTVCYQVMQSDKVEKIYEWIALWKDLVDFEVIPLISSTEAKAKVFSR